MMSESMQQVLLANLARVPKGETMSQMRFGKPAETAEEARTEIEQGKFLASKFKVEVGDNFPCKFQWEYDTTAEEPIVRMSKDLYASVMEG